MARRMPERPVMPSSLYEAPYWEEARKALMQADSTLGHLIRTSRGSVLRPRSDPFASLSRFIVGQQLSGRAAAAVWKKILVRVGQITPGTVARQSENTLHECGLSRPKARYLLCLADHFINGSFDQKAWHRMEDEAVIEELTQVKGIGRWTAEMFLIFHLLRPDVLPISDIGIQRGIANHFNHGIRPTGDEMVVIAQPWRPWRSVACWYLWRSLDTVPVRYQ